MWIAIIFWNRNPLLIYQVKYEKNDSLSCLELRNLLIDYKRQNKTLAPSARQENKYATLLLRYTGETKLINLVIQVPLKIHFFVQFFATQRSHF